MVRLSQAIKWRNELIKKYPKSRAYQILDKLVTKICRIENKPY